MIRVELNADTLFKIADLIKQGAITPVVGEVLSLDDIQKAHEISESGHARGKLVIKVKK